MSEELGIEVVPAASPEEALRGADIITTITTSATPVFDGKLLEEDKPIHINAMGAHYPWVREIDEYVMLRSRIILDEWEQGFSEHGEILIPIEEGLVQRRTWRRLRRPASDVHGDLGQVVAGRVAGRDANCKWTVFLSGGTGIEDVAVATKLYKLARKEGVGTEFEFNQPYDFEL